MADSTDSTSSRAHLKPCHQPVVIPPLVTVNQKTTLCPTQSWALSSHRYISNRRTLISYRLPREWITVMTNSRIRDRTSTTCLLSGTRKELYSPPRVACWRAPRSCSRINSSVRKNKSMILCDLSRLGGWNSGTYLMYSSLLFARFSLEPSAYPSF